MGLKDLGYPKGEACHHQRKNKDAHCRGVKKLPILRSLRDMDAERFEFGIFIVISQNRGTPI